MLERGGGGHVVVDARMDTGASGQPDRRVRLLRRAPSSDPNDSIRLRGVY
jgi:hypothetical protein